MIIWQIQRSSERGRSAHRRAALMTALSRRPPVRAAFYVGALGAAIFVIALIIWQGVTAHGTPDPMRPGTSPVAAFMDIGVLVFREGLECTLVLAAITASMTGRDQAHRRPVAIGAGMAFVATLITWFHRCRNCRTPYGKCSSARLASSDRPCRGHCSARDSELVFPQNLLGWLDSCA